MIYPIIVVQTRYGGIYEGGPWAAFAGWSIDEIARAQEGAFGGDIECYQWWDRNKHDPTIAVGEEPGDAVERVVSQIKEKCATAQHPPRFIIDRSNFINDFKVRLTKRWVCIACTQEWGEIVKNL